MTTTTRTTIISATPHRGRRLTAPGRRAGAQLGGDLMRAFPGRPRAVARPGAHRATGGLDPPAGRGDAANRAGQKPRIGRIGHIGRHHRGVHPDPGGAQQLRLRRLGQQGLIEPGHRRRPVPGGQLHQRGRMRHQPVERYPAKPPPGDRIGDLPTQRLIAQPVAKLSRTSTADRSPSVSTAGPSADQKRHKRCEKRRIIQQRINASQLFGQPQQPFGKHRLPQRALIAYSTKHDGLNPFQHKGLRPSSLLSVISRASTRRLFQVEVTNATRQPRSVGVPVSHPQGSPDRHRARRPTTRRL